MAKYHVGKDGQARPCKAASADSCPLAKADDSGVVKHFDSLDAAQSYGERVAMGLVGEDSSHEAPVAGVREAKDSERPATDDEISAYVFAANRKTLQNDVSVVPSSDGLEDSLSFKAATAEEKALIRDSLDRADAAVASGDFGVARYNYKIAAEHLGFDYDPFSFKSAPVLKRLVDRWDMATRSLSFWKDSLSMEDLPNDRAYDEERQLKPGTFSITEDGVIPLDKDSERSATEGKVERVRSANVNVLQHDVSIVSSFDRINDSPRFDAATAEEKALIRESLDRADAAVASGDFEAAADEYQTAMKHLGYDHGTDSFQPYDPVLDRLKDRWSLAYFASHAYSDKEHQLEAGSYFLADGAYVVPFYRRGDDDEDGIRR